MKSTLDSNTLWQQRIDTWRTSGLNQSAWCRQNDVKAPQFWYWKKKLSSAHAQTFKNEGHDMQVAQVVTSPAFVPVAVAPEAPEAEDPSCLTVTLPNGLTISDIDSTNITLVERLLEALL